MLTLPHVNVRTVNPPFFVGLPPWGNHSKQVNNQKKRKSTWQYNINGMSRGVLYSFLFFEIINPRTIGNNFISKTLLLSILKFKYLLFKKFVTKRFFQTFILFIVFPFFHTKNGSTLYLSMFICLIVCFRVCMLLSLFMLLIKIVTVTFSVKTS